VALCNAWHEAETKSNAHKIEMHAKKQNLDDIELMIKETLLQVRIVVANFAIIRLERGS
jgi:hypothetical protein